MGRLLTRGTLAAVLVAVCGSFLCGCSLLRQSGAVLRSTAHFLSYPGDPRVRFEPGAGNHAVRIVPFLPEAIRQVEVKQFRAFSGPVAVYVCATRESYRRLSGMDGRAGVLTKLFLSPRLFDERDAIVRRYLTHELSHLHLLQCIGLWRMRRLPAWFKEGLATVVSDGGGAQTVTEEQARAAMAVGRCFVPERTGGLLSQKTGSDWSLEPHMFYRQSMLFVRFLAADEAGFRKLLQSVENGERLARGLRAAYGRELEELWAGFLREVETAEGASVSEREGKSAALVLGGARGIRQEVEGTVAGVSPGSGNRRSEGRWSACAGAHRRFTRPVRMGSVVGRWLPLASLS